MSNNESENIPKNIGPYEIDKKINEGNNSQIYLGTSKYTGENVVIKLINKSIIQNNLDDLILVKNEIEILKLLKHRNIVTLYEVYETPKYFFIITEYLSNPDLGEVLTKRKRLSDDEAKVLFLQIIDAFLYMHNMQICHRDIKVEHILYDINNRPKIIDFGCGCFYKKSSTLNEPIGTISYSCPELIQQKPYDPELADVWSLGVLLFAIVCGYLPFSEEDDENNKKLIISGKIDFPKELGNVCKDLIKKMLDVNPKKRLNLLKVSRHPWLKSKMDIKLIGGCNIFLMNFPIDENILKIVSEYKLDEKQVENDMKENKYNVGTGLYRQIVRKINDLKIASKSDLSNSEYIEYSNNKENSKPEGEKKYQEYLNKIEERNNKIKNISTDYRNKANDVIKKIEELINSKDDNDNNKEKEKKAEEDSSVNPSGEKENENENNNDKKQNLEEKIKSGEEEGKEDKGGGDNASKYSLSFGDDDEEKSNKDNDNNNNENENENKEKEKEKEENKNEDIIEKEEEKTKNEENEKPKEEVKETKDEEKNDENNKENKKDGDNASKYSLSFGDEDEEKSDKNYVKEEKNNNEIKIQEKPTKEEKEKLIEKEKPIEKEKEKEIEKDGNNASKYSLSFGDEDEEKTNKEDINENVQKEKEESKEVGKENIKEKEKEEIKEEVKEIKEEKTEKAKDGNNASKYSISFGEEDEEKSEGIKENKEKIKNEEKPKEKEEEEQIKEKEKENINETQNNEKEKENNNSKYSISFTDENEEKSETINKIDNNNKTNNDVKDNKVDDEKKENEKEKIIESLDEKINIYIKEETKRREDSPKYSISFGDEDEEKSEDTQNKKDNKDNKNKNNVSINKDTKKEENLNNNEIKQKLNETEKEKDKIKEESKNIKKGEIKAEIKEKLKKEKEMEENNKDKNNNNNNKKNIENEKIIKNKGRENIEKDNNKKSIINSSTLGTNFATNLEIKEEHEKINVNKKNDLNINSNNFVEINDNKNKDKKNISTYNNLNNKDSSNKNNDKLRNNQKNKNEIYKNENKTKESNINNDAKKSIDLEINSKNIKGLILVNKNNKIDNKNVKNNLVTSNQKEKINSKCDNKKSSENIIKSPNNNTNTQYKIHFNIFQNNLDVYYDYYLSRKLKERRELIGKFGGDRVKSTERTKIKKKKSTGKYLTISEYKEINGQINNKNESLLDFNQSAIYLYKSSKSKSKSPKNRKKSKKKYNNRNFSQNNIFSYYDDINKKRKEQSFYDENNLKIRNFSTYNNSKEKRNKNNSCSDLFSYPINISNKNLLKQKTQSGNKSKSKTKTKNMYFQTSESFINTLNRNSANEKKNHKTKKNSSFIKNKKRKELLLISHENNICLSGTISNSLIEKINKHKSQQFPKHYNKLYSEDLIYEDKKNNLMKESEQIKRYKNSKENEKGKKKNNPSDKYKDFAQNKKQNNHKSMKYITKNNIFYDDSGNKNSYNDINSSASSTKMKELPEKDKGDPSLDDKSKVNEELLDRQRKLEIQKNKIKMQLMETNNLKLYLLDKDRDKNNKQIQTIKNDKRETKIKSKNSSLKKETLLKEDNEKFRMSPIKSGEKLPTIKETFIKDLPEKQISFNNSTLELNSSSSIKLSNNNNNYNKSNYNKLYSKWNKRKSEGESPPKFITHQNIKKERNKEKIKKNNSKVNKINNNANSQESINIKVKKINNNQNQNSLKTNSTSVFELAKEINKAKNNNLNKQNILEKKLGKFKDRNNHYNQYDNYIINRNLSSSNSGSQFFINSNLQTHESNNKNYNNEYYNYKLKSKEKKNKVKKEIIPSLNKSSFPDKDRIFITRADEYNDDDKDCDSEYEYELDIKDLNEMNTIKSFNNNQKNHQFFPISNTSTSSHIFSNNKALKNSVLKNRFNIHNSMDTKKKSKIKVSKGNSSSYITRPNDNSKYNNIRYNNTTNTFFPQNESTMTTIQKFNHNSKNKRKKENNNSQMKNMNNFEGLIENGNTLSSNKNLEQSTIIKKNYNITKHFRKKKKNMSSENICFNSKFNDSYYDNKNFNEHMNNYYQS